MKYFKYILLSAMLIIVSCDLPNESVIYHWAEHWIAIMDANGQNIQYVHRSVNIRYWNDRLIAFEKDNTLNILDADINRILIVNSDGSQAMSLLENYNASLNRCSVSADGQFVVYSQKGNLYKKATDGSILIPLVVDSNYYDADPQFSPQNQEVVFVRNWNDSKNDAVMLLSENGDQLIRLTDNFNDPSKKKQISYPTFSYDGKRIYYYYYNSQEASGIYVIDRHSGIKRQIYSSTWISNTIEVSSKGDVAFSFGKYLFVADSSGNQILNLGEQFARNSAWNQFKFSPDGNLIIVSDGDYSNAQIKIIDLQTQTSRIICSGWSPSFLPDGRILFITKRFFESKNKNDVPYDRIYF